MVSYSDGNSNVKSLIQEGIRSSYTKTDAKAAFRLIPLKSTEYSLLMMKAQHPETAAWYYFCDKYLSFRNSQSCALYQDFSNSLVHPCKYRNGEKATSYL